MNVAVRVFQRVALGCGLVTQPLVYSSSAISSRGFTEWSWAAHNTTPPPKAAVAEWHSR